MQSDIPTGAEVISVWQWPAPETLPREIGNLARQLGEDNVLLYHSLLGWQARIRFLEHLFEKTVLRPSGLDL